jgi:TetR/AcrR family transcriptional regulator, tetracycline repressor protein
VPLRRADVLTAAMALLDVDGLDGVTMRRLAANLHVQPGALYWHFADKQALLDAMAEQLLATVSDSLDDGAPWQQRVRDLAIQVRAALLAHRDGARLSTGTYVAQPHTLRTGQKFMQALLEAGLSHEQAGTAVFALVYYISGYTIEEQARIELIDKGQWAQRLDALDDEQFPDIARAARALDTDDPDTRFQRGLQIFIEGLPIGG